MTAEQRYKLVVDLEQRFREIGVSASLFGAPHLKALVSGQLTLIVANGHWCFVPPTTKPLERLFLHTC